MPTIYGMFFNSQSGDGKGSEIAKQLRNELSKKHYDSLMITGKNADDAVNSVKQTLSKINVLIAIGGDGTINLAMTALVQTRSELPIGIIPAGTVSNFAKRCHLPLDVDHAIKIVIDIAQTRPVGIGVCNGTKAIVSSLTFGNLADLSNDVRQEEKRKFGKVVYLVKAIQHIGRNKSFRVKMTLDDTPPKTVKVWFALITTTKSVGGHVYDESATNKTHISMLSNIKFHKVISYLYFALSGHLRDSKSIDYFTSSSARFEPVNNADIETRIDGDKATLLPISVEYKSDFLRLIVS